MRPRVALLVVLLLLLVGVAVLTLRWGPATGAAARILLTNFGVIESAGARVTHAIVDANGVPADLYVPAGCPCPGLVLTLGVAPLPNDDPMVVRLAQSLADAGFVVLLPQQPDLFAGRITDRAVADLAAAIAWLQNSPSTAGRPVSAGGFSVGASLMTLASDRLQQPVRGIFWFGGFGNVAALLDSIACHRLELDGQWRPWTPSETAEAIAASQDVALPERADPACTAPQVSIALDPRLAGISPALTRAPIRNRTPLFVLHDRGDAYVPFVESRRFVQGEREARPAGSAPVHALETELFDHVVPRSGLDWIALRDGVQLALLLTSFIDNARG